MKEEARNPATSMLGCLHNNGFVVPTPLFRQMKLHIFLLSQAIFRGFHQPSSMTWKFNGPDFSFPSYLQLLRVSLDPTFNSIYFPPLFPFSTSSPQKSFLLPIAMT